MKYSLLTALITLYCLSLQAQDYYSRVKLFGGIDELELLASRGLAIDNGIFKAGTWVVCELSQQELDEVEAAGIAYEILIGDVSRYYEERNAPYLERLDEIERATYTLSREWPVPDGFELGPVGGFLTIDQCMEHLDSMAAQYPDLISPRYAMDHTSQNGRQMFWVRLSDNPSADENEPEVLYTGMHHAREAIGMAALLYYMYYLLENYDTDPDVQYIVNHYELYFVPIINVDGYAYNIQIEPNGGGMWRKNRRTNDDGSYGVDLNRNYGYMWGYDNNGSSPEPSDETYRGISAFSEPELQNIRDFCNAHEFRLALNYHSYADLLLHPWGYTPELCPDDGIFNAFGEILTYENGYEYGPGSTTIYPTNGGSDDWMYGEQETKAGIFSYTPEVGDGSAGFWPPVPMIIPLCQASMWQNITLARLAGPWAAVKDIAPSILENSTGLLFFEIKRLGLEDGATYTVSIEPLNDAIATVSGPMTFSDLEVLETASAAFTYSLREDIQSGDAVDYLLSMNNGLVTFSDTIRKIFGIPTVIFQDTVASFQKWTSNKWNVTSYQYHSPDKSIADSPNGQYNDYENNSMILNETIDLGGAVFAALNFWAKWDIEAGYDYVQVLVSDNNGLNWTALEGNYTSPGSEYQLPGQPLYDGTQSSWVREEMSLEPFLGKQIKLRFVLKSDSYVTADGFYWDDMTVTVVDIATGIENRPSDSPSIVNLHPNPATDRVYVTLSNGFELSDHARLIVYSQTGRKILDMALDKASASFDVSAWPPGLYFFRAMRGNIPEAGGKFIVQ